MTWRSRWHTGSRPRIPTRNPRAPARAPLMRLAAASLVTGRADRQHLPVAVADTGSQPGCRRLRFLQWPRLRVVDPGRLGWQFDREPRTAFWSILGPYSAAVHVHHVSHDGEPQPKAAVRARPPTIDTVEAIEHTLECV